MPKRITITDLAKAADVSISTIDRILNKRGPVQRATAEHVLATAQRIGFQGLPNLRRRLSEEAPERTFGFLLNRRERLLYGSLARALVTATSNSTNIRGKAIVRHIDDLSPTAAAEALEALGEECDSIAGVCVEHPKVNKVIHDLSSRGIPFWAMLSDVSSQQRAGFVGANGWKLGRSAGWMMARLCPPRSRIGIFVGSELYLGQKEFEAGFRSYLRETDNDYVLLHTRQTHEDDQRAHDLTVAMLDEEPELAAIFMAGGGIDGIVRARWQRPNRKLAIVSTEISEMTHGHLVDDLVDIALSHEFEQVATTVVKAMEMRSLGEDPGTPSIHNIPMKIVIRENV